ncbi:MAG: 2-oxo-4-hydroxy-4-carboxy-5-ureidoimidazoline decarboxylase [Halieaceae bacterium]|jgi:2-oxo-4-hydroxy-4-carboxy-5-ureidoimidazoline decarboxylase|nr:2-oxo-4-hydroxy-4-carboxy-5-ureidoimidazoline decarboxylase [Halieaceae bacterium]
MDLADFNALQHDAAVATLLEICHCHRWAEAVSEGRPFDDIDALAARCDSEWQHASEAEILEAFAGHPRIGDVNALRDKYSSAGREQGHVGGAPETVLDQLLACNRDYEARHGFIFIVCASGKSAEEMLALLQARLPNSREQELATGAAEQAKITALRLRRLFAADTEESTQ